MNTNQKINEIAILISDNVDFTEKKINKDLLKGHFIIIKGPIHIEDIILTCMHLITEF